MLNGKIVWQGEGNACKPDARQCERVRQRENRDHRVIATSLGDAVLHAACMATLQAMETEHG